MAFMRGTEFEKAVLETLGLAGRPVVALTLKLRVNEMPVIEVEELVQQGAEPNLEFLTRTTQWRQVEEKKR